jgi:uncharacterized membrane protein YoaK (UPF0700 family)
MNNLKEKLASSQVRERVVALFCLTVIAIVAMFKLSDPENIVINIVVGIVSFVGGAVANSMRRTDKTDTKET